MFHRSKPSILQVVCLTQFVSLRLAINRLLSRTWTLLIEIHRKQKKN